MMLIGRQPLFLTDEAEKKDNWVPASFLEPVT